jgi:type I restriction enzyme S subunit
MNTIGNLFKITKGKKAQESLNNTSLRYIQIEDLRGDINIKFAEENNGNILCNKNDILIAWDGANAGTVGYGLKGVIGSTIAKLTPKLSNLSTEYCGIFLKSKFKYLRENCTGATIPHISRQSLEELKLPIPPLPVQKKIAAILGVADEIKQKDKAIISKYKELTYKLFYEMFGDPAINPNNWPEKPVVSICKHPNDIKCGPFGTQLQKSEYQKQGVPLWGIPQINSYFQKPVEDFLTLEKADELKQYSIEPLDIVMSRKGNVGKCAIYPVNFSVGILH